GAGRGPGGGGGSRRCTVSTVWGSARGRYGARQAASTTPASTTRARSASRLRAPRLLILDAWVEPGVEQVDGEVDQHEGQRDDEHATLHEGEIPREDALHHEESHARPGEDRLREDGAAQQVARLHAHHGDDGNQRVLETVTEEDARLHEALGARGPDVVLIEDLEHGAARQARDDGERRGRQRHGREDGVGG